MPRQLPRILRVPLLLLTFLITLLLPPRLAAAAKNFTYNGVNYTVVSETDKTCQTKSGFALYGGGVKPGTKISGNVILPETVYDGSKAYRLVEIGQYSFYGCAELTSITIPESVTKIFFKAFYGCSGLTSITIPESVVLIHEYAFDKCTLAPLKFLEEPELWGNWDLKTGSYILCKSSFVDKALKASRGRTPVYTVDSPYQYSITPLFNGVNITLEDNSQFYEGWPEVKVVKADVSSKGSEKSSYELKLGDNIIKGLEHDKDYYVRIYGHTIENDDQFVYSIKEFHTNKPSVSVSKYATQSTITIRSVSAEKDESVEPVIHVCKDISMYHDLDKWPVYTGGEVKITGLNPDCDYTLVYADYNGTKVYPRNSIKTKPIDISITPEVGPTSAKLSGAYDLGDAVAPVERTQWSVKTPDGSWSTMDNVDRISIAGLPPSSSLECMYQVYLKGSNIPHTAVYTCTTPALTLEILAPKCVTSDRAIVAARTNILDNEVNVGFEWKKYNAPESLPYNVGYGAVRDGMVEGMIQNLQPEYYNVRAFYKDASGRYYYSDLTTFDPTDFSYFEPTVHTYPVESIGANQATLHGYALGGSDRILSQGFRYWYMGVADAPARAGAPDDADIRTVQVDGQVMTAVITDLLPGRVYGYCAYVETDSGIVCGEEQTFRTLGESGVNDVTDDMTEPEILGYYDLSGRRYDTPQRGFNIVLYSNWRTAKIIAK